MSDETTDTTDTAETAAPHEPRIQVLNGHPTDAELAALIVVLGCAGGGPPPPRPESTRWGLPVDRLRYAMHNYQRITLQGRVHMHR